MSIIQRRADSDAKSGKYVAAIDRWKQYLSTDYGKTFIESNINFNYLPAGAAIAEKTGEIFVVSRGSYNSVFVSRDNFATLNSLDFARNLTDVVVVEIAKNGEELYILDNNRGLWTLNVPTNTGAVEWLSDGYGICKFSVSSNGKYRVRTGKQYMWGYNDYRHNLLKEIASPYATNNELKDVAMSGDGKYIFYSFVSGSLDYNGIFRIHWLGDWNTVDRISVAGINNYYIPVQICVSHTGKHVILRYTGSTGSWISHDFCRSFTKLPDADDYIMSSNGKYVYYRYDSILYRSNDYGNTFSLVLYQIHGNYALAISK